MYINIFNSMQLYLIICICVYCICVCNVYAYVYVYVYVYIIIYYNYIILYICDIIDPIKNSIVTGKDLPPSMPARDCLRQCLVVSVEDHPP